MKHRIALEEIEPGHWIAWALDWPGCFSSAGTAEEALARAPERIAAYANWLRAKDPSLPWPDGAAIELVERFEAFTAKDDPDYIVNAFFEDDRRALSAADVAHALRLLTWTREDLLQAAQSARTAGMAGLDVDSIIRHVANAENWYLDRLDLALPNDQLPEEPIERLKRVRERLRARLPELIGSTRAVTLSDESWSAHKLVRRALWHERDHTAQIAQRIAGAG